MNWSNSVKYPYYLTDEDIEAFELDMERFYEDAAVVFDQINRELREIAAFELDMERFYENTTMAFDQINSEER